MAALDVKDLRKSFDGRYYVLKDVSFSILKGEVVGVVGESGSGKSTLLKILMGLLKPDSGLIEFQEKNRQIIFQDPAGSFDPLLTIGASLTEALILNGQKNKALIRQIILSLLESVELAPDLADRFPHQISGGQCQRAAIARALSRQPGLLFCDEPVSSLDSLSQAKILNLFLKLQKEKQISLLFASHDLRAVRHLCDRVLVLKEGQIRESGPTSQVFENPQDSYTRELISAAGIA